MTKTNVQSTPSNSQHHDTPNNKTHVIKFRVTAEEKASLELTCKLLNLSLSTFIRRAILKRVTERKDRWVSPLYWTGSYRSACVSLSSRSVKRDFIRKATAFAPIGHRNMQSGVSSMS